MLTRLSKFIFCWTVVALLGVYVFGVGFYFDYIHPLRAYYAKKISNIGLTFGVWFYKDY